MTFLRLTHATLDKEILLVPELIMAIYQDKDGLVKVVSNAGTYISVKEDLGTVETKYKQWKNERNKECNLN